MANKPSHGVQQRILAFVASKPNREISRNGSVESCTSWIAKRLDVPEKMVIAEIENMERDGLVKLNRSIHRGITQVQVVRTVEPEAWAVDEMVQKGDEPVKVVLPANLDYRKLADNVLLAALEVLGSSDERAHQDKINADEMANLTEANAQLRAELSHVKAERDANTRARKVAEDAARDEKNKADEARTNAAEWEADVEELRRQVNDLHAQIRTLAIGADLLKNLDPDEQYQAASALAKLLGQN